MFDHLDFVRDLLIDAVVTYILVVHLFYRRHGDRDMAISLGMFNVCLFTIIIALTMTEINMGAGFALFAILSIISLRSVNIAKIEIGYLFAVIALGLINGISFPDYSLLALANLTVLLAVLVLDSQWFIKPILTVEITLDEVPLTDLKDLAKIRSRLADTYELQVRSIHILRYSPDKNTLRLTVRFNLP